MGALFLVVKEKTVFFYIKAIFSHNNALGAQKLLFSAYALGVTAYLAALADNPMAGYFRGKGITMEGLSDGASASGLADAGRQIAVGGYPSAWYQAALPIDLAGEHRNFHFSFWLQHATILL